MLSVLFLLWNLHIADIRQTGTACDGTWMQLMKSVLNVYFFSVLFGTLPLIAYMLVWNLSKSVNAKYFIIAAEFASCIFGKSYT